MEIQKGLNKLTRGGYLISTESGYIQYGSPPETIKDTMVLPESVPRVFILPGELFSIEKGIAVAELEFPLYFNHFLKQKKTRIVCTEEQKNQILMVLQESVFGPQKVNLESEFINGKESPGFPEMEKEMKYFRGNRVMSDLVEFSIFKDGKVKIDDVVIQRNENKNYEIYESGVLIASLPWTIDFNIKYAIGEKIDAPFEAPEYGITCLGPSHGFDPNDNTSGFIIWINHRGIMIDPPVNSTEWLRDSNVNPKLISHVILTHCHADHDAGTFQKILEESSITIHTTETVMDSFMRKYTALTKMKKKVLLELFNFNPVMINRPIFIEGGEFIFYYALHSIPTIGFRLHYRNQTFVYSSDHLNDPKVIETLYEKEILSKTRLDSLNSFPWHYNTIYHESGVPPIHTPISYLASLPDEIQKKITVYHISRKDFPDGSQLKLAEFGIGKTVYPKVEKSHYENAAEVLDVLNNIDIFEDFKLSKAREFLTIVHTAEYKKGDQIIKKGTPGDAFYIIKSGKVSVRNVGANYKKEYGRYDYFGEASLFTGNPRSADVIAETDVTALKLEKNAFKNFIEGSNLEKNLQQLIKIRDSRSWDLLSGSSIFGGMTSHQKTQLENIMKYVKGDKGKYLLKEGKVVDHGYLIIKGRVEISKKGRRIKDLTRGDFAGDIFSMQKKIGSPFSAKLLENTELYGVHVESLKAFIQKNPGVYMRLLRFREEILSAE